MATKDDIQTEIDGLEARKEALQQRLPVTPNAKDRAAINAQIGTLNEQISAKKNELSTAAMATPRALSGTEIGLAASTLKNTLDNLARNADQADKALRADPASEEAFNSLQTALTSLFRAEQSAVANGIQITPSVSLRNGLYVRTREGVTATPTQAPAGPPADEARRIGRRPISGPAIKEAPEEVTPPAPTGGTPTVVTPTEASTAPVGGAANQWVATQLELRNMPDTPENRKMLRGEYRKRPAASTDWKAEFEQRYPDLANLINLDPEIAAIAERAVNEEWFRYPEQALSILTREIANTPYGRTATETQRTFDSKRMQDQMDLVEDKMSRLKGAYGGLGLDDNEWFNISRNAVRSGLNDNQVKSEIYSTVYRRDPNTGQFAFENAVKQVEQGKLAQDVNGVFQNEFLLAQPGSEYLESYARGEITLEDVRRQARVLAKQRFPGLSDFIDQGLNVKAIADQYRSQAATILEMPSTGIDMNDPKFLAALDFRDEQGSRPMSFGEFTTLLKTDPNYGWQYTKQANKQALDIATTIARTFGKVV